MPKFEYAPAPETRAIAHIKESYGLFINGEFTPSKDGGAFKTISPATEEVLAEMRASATPIHYLVGTPRGRLTKLEKGLAAKPWEEVRESVRVKLIEHGEETYVLARSEARREKDQGAHAAAPVGTAETAARIRLRRGHAATRAW